MALEELDLSHLNATERDVILAVLQRDEALRQKEQERVKVLKNEVRKLRLSSVIRDGRDVNKTCARCRQALGLIFNKGAPCPRCQMKICQKPECRAELTKTSWLCVVCFRQTNLEAKTGNWFYAKYPKAFRDRKTNQIIPGVDIVRASIRRSKPANPVAGGAMTRTSRGTAGTAGVSHAAGSTSHTLQSQLSTGPSTQRPADLSRSAFPQDDDQQILDDLLQRRTATSPNHTTARVAGRRSDSSSAEDSDGAHRPHDTSLTAFDKTDPLRTSVRTNASSIVSHDGVCVLVTDDESSLPGDAELNVSSSRRGTTSPARSARGGRTTPARAFDEVDAVSVGAGSLASRQSGQQRVHYDSDHSGTSATPSIIVTSPDRQSVNTSDNDNVSQISKSRFRSKSHNSLNHLSASKESILSVYSNAGEEHYGKIAVTGEIQLALSYNHKRGQLEVDIRQCRDLAAVDEKKQRSDPYVKTYLLPDKTKTGKRKTKAKRHTLNPVFEQVLKYNITMGELETRTLCAMVWHSDTFGHNDFLGEVNLSLDQRSLTDPSPKWYTLQSRSQPAVSMLAYKGDLNISLKYVPAENVVSSKKRGSQKGELTVLIKQARNLTAVRSNGSSDPFCKGYLLPERGRTAKQKTTVVKHNCNPTWNYTFVFEEVTWKDLTERSLELTVWDYDRLTSNDFLGGVRLNLGTGLSGGSQVDWMDARGEEVSLWQSMLDRPNCWIDGTLFLRLNMTQRK